ncbi:MAG: Ig-like domain-containing protein [Verrucomicrobiales bacterium]|nr:Ig-like domain-containing protein [Verrucomicrobiales bacterium]
MNKLNGKLACIATLITCGASSPITAWAAEVPADSLALWLKADTGVTLNGAAVVEWADQSGLGRNAAQATTTSQPTLVPDGANGKPALQFDGTDDFLSFTFPINDLQDMTVFLVSACGEDIDVGFPFAGRSALFWNEAAGWGTTYLSPFQSVVRWRFGVGTPQDLATLAYTRPAPLANTLSATTLLREATTTGNESLFVNGELALTATDKTAVLGNNTETGNIGRGYNNDTYFPGTIAEVLIYTRALSDAERQSVESYLNTKYLSNKLPTANITSPAANEQFTAPASIAITAQAADTDGTISKVEFFQGNTKLGEDTTGPDYSLTWNDVPSGNYALTAVATDNAGAYQSSSAIQVLVSSPGGPPFAGLGLWLKADAGVTLNGSSVSAWADQSGLGRNAEQANAANQPTLVSDDANGKPALRFDGADDFLTFNFPVNDLQDMTVFLVSACSEDIDVGFPFVARGALFWNESSSWGTIVLSPFQSIVRWRFGIGESQDLAALAYPRPTPLLNEFSTTTLLREGSTTGTESLFINSELALAVTDKTAPVAATRDQGNLGRGWNDDSYFPGGIAEVLVYTRALSATEQSTVETYLKSKYFGPTDLTFTSISRDASGRVVLQWAGTGVLEEANAVTGAWTPTADQSNPQILTPSAPTKFYRLRK